METISYERGAAAPGLKPPARQGTLVDAASQRADPISPGEIVVIYGAGLGPALLVQNQASGGLLGAALGGTTVSFNGIAGPILYSSATQIAAVAPYGISGTTANVTVSYEGQLSSQNFGAVVVVG